MAGRDRGPFSPSIWHRWASFDISYPDLDLNPRVCVSAHLSRLLPALAFSSGYKPGPALFCSRVPRSPLPGAPQAYDLGSEHTPCFVTPCTSMLETEVSALFYYLKLFCIKYTFLLLDVCLGRAICQHKTVKILYFLYITIFLRTEV